MTFKTITGTPPNYRKIITKFPVPHGAHVFYAYAPHVYSPSGAPLPEVLRGHEALHIRRQLGNPELWWDFYIKDIDFRREEELVAHVVEYYDRVACEGDNRSSRRRNLRLVASRLAHRIYGPMYTKNTAKMALIERIEEDE